jgi:hypothetical protein
LDRRNYESYSGKGYSFSAVLIRGIVESGQVSVTLVVIRIKPMSRIRQDHTSPGPEIYVAATVIKNPPGIIRITRSRIPVFFWPNFI